MTQPDHLCLDGRTERQGDGPAPQEARGERRDLRQDGPEQRQGGEGEHFPDRQIQPQ